MIDIHMNGAEVHAETPEKEREASLILNATLSGKTTPADGCICPDQRDSTVGKGFSMRFCDGTDMTVTPTLDVEGNPELEICCNMGDVVEEAAEKSTYYYEVTLEPKPVLRSYIAAAYDLCNELTDSELEQMGHDRKTGRIRLLHALETVDIDQWKPTDIIQSAGRKRPLDADDTCTVYFRDYDADWYYGDLKKFKAIVTEELKPAVAYLAGAEAFEVFRNSGTPDSINKKIRKCRIMEFDDAKGEYRVNLLGVRQLKRELELLNEMLETSYKQVFAKSAPVLAEDTVPYCFDSVADWIDAHLNQPMLKEEMCESIMALNVFKEYKGRPMGQDILNRKLQIYGVKIVTVREFKRNENRNRTFWKLIRI